MAVSFRLFGKNLWYDRLGPRVGISSSRNAKAVCHRRVRAQAHRSSAPPLPIEFSGALVYPANGSVKGICHFLGGVFACAAPQVVYPLMIDLLVSSGYTVIATPFAATFKHKECAVRLHKVFWQTLDDLRSSSHAYSVPFGVPVHGVGHSMGALMQLLIGTFCDAPYPNSNIMIAVNHKEVEGAVPIPGLFESLQATASAFKNVTFSPLADPLPLMRSLTATVIGSIGNDPIRELYGPSVAPAFDQIESILGEFKEGVSDFVPTPSEARKLIQSQYKVPSTLFIRFTDDTIDETEEIMGIVKSGQQTYVTDQLLEGNHLTPVGGDLEWLGPTVPGGVIKEANGSIVKGNETLVRGMLEWMDSFAD